MKIFLCVVIYSLFISQSRVQASTPDSPTYVAAVVEYSPVTASDGDTAADVVTKNLANYVLHIQRAAEEGADIIVFPECGLVTFAGHGSFSTHLPNPEDRVNPCTDDSSGVEEVVRTLSCEARNRSIYVVVNIPEMVPCSSATNCSSSDVLLYNSNVVFDRDGTVVARYRKFNLFGEPGFSATLEPELSVFDTDFGVKFGTFTCFDIMFEKPAVSLVRALGVTDVVFPTAWFSQLPFHSAVQVQSSWASSMDVNFLASGYNNPRGGSSGSGIYAGKEGPIVAVMPTVPSTQLLLAVVPKKSFQRTKHVSSNVSNVCELITATPYRNAFPERLDGNDSGITMLSDYLEPYETLLLTENEFFSKHTVCHNELCCDFELVMHRSQQIMNSSYKDNVYRLAVFDGIRSYTYVTAGVQICAVISCINDSLSSCVKDLKLSKQEMLNTVFDYVHISGNFRQSNSIHLPITLVRGYDVLSSDKFQFTREEMPERNEIKVDMKTSRQNSNLLTFAIFGRDFQKDGGLLTLPSRCHRTSAATVTVLITVAVILCLHTCFKFPFSFLH